MSRRSSNNAVTLFPFLAVLVCAMGALILLLLVTTRRIRQHAELDLEVPVAEQVVPAPVETSSAADRDAERLRLLEEKRARYERARTERLQEIDALAKHWQAQYETVQQQNRRLSERLASLNAQISLDVQEEAEARRREQQFQDLLAAAGNEQRQLQARQEQLKQEAEKLKVYRDQAVQRLAAQQERPAQKPRFEIVAYDGVSGTERRPILIECRTDSLIFAAERISLDAEALTGYSPDDNPLRAGTEALVQYWNEVDQQHPATATRPYVLLIVRPGGTVGFYVARKLLEKMKYDYGYELVFQDEEFQWPEPDPEAVRRCQEAVDRALARKPATSSRRGLPGSGGDDFFTGSEGEFRLAEVDRLRRAPGSVLSIDEDWVPRRHQARGSGTEPVPNRFNSSPESQRARQMDAPENAPFGTNDTGPAGAPQGSSAGMAPRAPRASERLSGYPQEAESTSSRGPDGLPPPPGTKTERLIDDGGQKRQWGHNRSNGMIGIERKVTVHLRGEFIEVQGQRFPVAADLDRAEFQQLVAAALHAEALSWGEPPEAFTWRPALSITIHPGGNRHYPRLKELVDHWGLASDMEYALD